MESPGGCEFDRAGRAGERSIPEPDKDADEPDRPDLISVRPVARQGRVIGRTHGWFGAGASVEASMNLDPVIF
jgi:hypothetical protein